MTSEVSVTIPQQHKLQLHSMLAWLNNTAGDFVVSLLILARKYQWEEGLVTQYWFKGTVTA